jgi:hypothetical protein
MFAFSAALVRPDEAIVAPGPAKVAALELWSVEKISQ